ncbi:GDSL-type esterase/lipase family protein [Zongyangia sp. HA2173]|uniref:GDSL-type esterase/lipase family protein n=1 Tax=Zongyangia sp. HA2173 TaxID=3133035 RepID=UPI00316421D0
MYGKRKQSPLVLILLSLGLILLAGIIVVVMLWLNQSDEPSLANQSSSSASIQTTPPITDESSSSATESLSQSQSQPQPVYAFGQPIPETPQVDDSYFDDAMFVGDSITTGIELYGVMPNATVVASTGINPNTIMTTPDIELADGSSVTILQAMSAYHPKKIYIMLGSNGVEFIGKETMMELYGEFIDAVKAQHPDSIIYLQSILPVTQAKEAASPELSNDKIDEYNAAIMELAGEKEAYYLNVAESFKDETGALPDEASPNDGMHFGVSHYEIWMDYLKCHAVEISSQDSNS